MSPDPLPPVTPRRSTLATLLLVGLIFLGGAVVGGGVTLVVVGQRLQEAAQRPELMPERMADRLGRKLDLDERQRSRIQRVLERHNDEFLGIRRDSARRLRKPLRHMREDIERELSPRQAERWRAHMDDMEGRFLPPGVSSATGGPLLDGGPGAAPPEHPRTRSRGKDRPRGKRDREDVDEDG